MADVKQLVNQRIGSITADDWGRCVQHTIKIEDKYRQIMGIVDAIEPVVFNINSDDSDTSSSESENEI